ncbi:YidC/Oxa1 family membrane protein insertase [Leucobacter sp. M11]|uniref:YidC/Oxa1 family membrane protein insertase n=1 Tax=Leucobacter sp. M11 TaxID=2993565 RepID=UPI002D8016DB|nr:membrane protein insertase YidC [Leucobacter sp. M11]MEB4614123.1 membrane protein insertase YidC [Leucobacter sp. M11]
MNIYDFAPIRALINGAYWVVTALSELLAPLAGGASAALAVILLTVLVRTLLIPVGRSQVKAGITRERIAPKLQEIQKKYRKNPELLQRKTMELYAAEKASPFAGCLPVLFQMPVLMGVYGLFILPEIGGEPNELLSRTFLGIPLGTGFLGQITAGEVTWTSALVFLAIIVIIAVVAQFSRRLLTPPTPPQQARPEPQPGMPAMPDLSGMMRVMSFMPFMTAVIAAFVPLAAALYLMTTTAWTLVERLVLRRVMGATPIPKA